MSLAITIVPVCPIRETASHRSEQVSQLLFGEACEIIETGKNFLHVKTVHDNYTGWCQSAQLAGVANDVVIMPSVLAAGYVNHVVCNSKIMPVPFGCNVGFLGDGEMAIGNQLFSYQGEIWDVKEAAVTAANIEKIALTYLNTAYQWGGRSVYGIDCSGLTQMVFKFLGVPLLRDASMQATHGEVVGFLQEAKCGDLAFFDNEEGAITHVGILLNPEKIVHASGKVRIDDIDHAGIINDAGTRTHNLRLIKRII